MSRCRRCDRRIGSGSLCQECRLKEYYGDATDDRGRGAEGEDDEFSTNLNMHKCNFYLTA